MSTERGPGLAQGWELSLCGQAGGRGGKQDQRCQREMGAGRQGAGDGSQGRQCRRADHQGKWCAGEGRWGRARILDTGLQGALSSLLWAPGLGEGRFLPALLTPAVRRTELRLQKLVPQSPTAVARVTTLYSSKAN